MARIGPYIWYKSLPYDACTKKSNMKYQDAYMFGKEVFVQRDLPIKFFNPDYCQKIFVAVI